MLDIRLSGGKVVALDGELKMTSDGYTEHNGTEQPCANDLPIAYITWDGRAKGNYSDLIDWSEVKFWKVEE